MKEVFADTQYLVAMLDRRDPWSARAHAASRLLDGATIVTTDDVLVEMLGFVSAYGPRVRRVAVDTCRSLWSHSGALVIPQSRELLDRGLDLYATRLDKGYSLVDCISMVTMRSRGIRECLTADRHFAQEGFAALMMP